MLKKYIMRYIALLLSSKLRTQVHRKWWQLKCFLSPRSKTVEIFIKADDPYSYLLIQVLPMLQQRFKIKWDIYIISQMQEDMYPEPTLWHHNALIDACRLATLYQLRAPSKSELSSHAITAATAKLLSNQHSLENMSLVFDELWHGKPNSPTTLTNQQQAMLKENEHRLLRRGHYLAASIWCMGDWYWGLDRLDHLETKLNDLNLNVNHKTVYFNKTYAEFCRTINSSKVASYRISKPIILYFSIRSPYSHLALKRCVELSKHYNLPLIIKPIIPMVMRGLNVPSPKKFYIFFDTKREADKYNIDYGFVSDPLGNGVRRCYALFEYAQKEGKEIEYLLNYSNAVNAEGVLSDTDHGLKRIVERSGLNWKTAKALLTNNSWQTTWPSWTEANEAELKQLGLWGVPSIKFEECVVWGQDRLEFIEQSIRKTLID